jgi:hypothetical protein
VEEKLKKNNDRLAVLPSSGILHVCIINFICMYFWSHTDSIVIDLSFMYEQKDTCTNRHHTDIYVLDT